ncbi:MAG: hypothetical protein KGI60_02400 [Patescibacteria group bacterium]|nr:hypothetical protein [Patescibacteria group bacterium]
MNRVHAFTQPERMAIEEVLNLLRNGRMEVVNMQFFSRIESSPVMPINEPKVREVNKDHNDSKTPYLQTTVRFFCRGVMVAAVVIEGCFSRGRRASGALFMWRTAALKARLYYWRNSDQPARSRRWMRFTPLHTNYGSMYDDTVREELKFQKGVASSLGWGRKLDGSEEHNPLRSR